MRRGVGPMRCGKCAHQLDPSQEVCPECGRTWRPGDPGSARVFVMTADALERRRRTWLVQQWVMTGAAAVLLVWGTPFAVGLFPTQPFVNAVWFGPMQTAARGTEWSDSDVEMVVRVEGWHTDQEAFSKSRSRMQVERMQVTAVTPRQRTAPLEDVPAAESSSPARIVIERDYERSPAGVWYMVESTDARNITSGHWGVSLDLRNDYSLNTLSRLIPLAFPDLTKQQIERLAPLMLRILAGGATDDHCVWGNSHSSFEPPERVKLAKSTQQQRYIGSALVALVAAVVALSWIRVLWLDRSRRPWGRQHRGELMMSARSL